MLATQTPLYEADIVLQVEAQPQGSSLGIGANIEGALSGPRSRVATEIEVMQSRRLLGSVVDDLHLDVSAAPRYFPRSAAPSPTAGAGTGWPRRSWG